MFANHALEQAKISDLKLPANEKDFAATVRRVRKNEGATGWMLDIIEAGLRDWKAFRGISPDEDVDCTTFPGAGVISPDDDDTLKGDQRTGEVVGRLEAVLNGTVPADLEFLIDAVPKLDAMSQDQRHAAINYIRDRYFTHA